MRASSINRTRSGVLPAARGGLAGFLSLRRINALAFGFFFLKGCVWAAAAVLSAWWAAT